MYSTENNLQLARDALTYISELEIKSPQSLYTPSYAATTQYKHLRINVTKMPYTRVSNPIEFGRLEDEIGTEMKSITQYIIRSFGGYCNPLISGFGLYRQHGCCAKLSQEVEDERIKEIIRITKARCIGGCEFQSWVVYDYLVNAKHVDAKVQVVALNNYDHWLVIIGEGLDVVVCDPWAFNCYPMTELAQQIQDLFKVGAISKTSWWDASFSYIVVRSNKTKTHYD